MGAHIRGAGTNIIIIDGVDKFHGTRHQVIPDRIEAGTALYLAAAVVVRESVLITFLRTLRRVHRQARGEMASRMTVTE